MLEEEKRIALLIDADNAPAKYVQKIFSELARYGKVTIRRAYGNWKSSRLKGWDEVLQDHAIQPFQQSVLTIGKNATDIAMVVDAMDILHTKQVSGFCLVSSDCDFTPLATHILSEGKIVIGFGERKTPDAFVNVCSTFLFLDEERPAKGSSSNLKDDIKLVGLIWDAIASMENDEGWVLLSRVGAHISNHASFDPRNYGYPRLSDLINAIELFELRRDEKGAFEVKAMSKEQPAKASSSDLKGDTKLVSLIRDTIDKMKNDEGWAPLSRVGAHLNHASPDWKNYGYLRLSDLVNAIGLFELKWDEITNCEVKAKP